ncbi:MAG: ATP-binding protein [Ginsengibacter sp.]
MLTNLTPALTSPNLFEAIFNNAKQNNILVLDKKGYVIAVNEAFTQCFGYRQEDVAGVYLSIFFTEEDRQKGLPEREIKQVLEKGQSSDNNYLVSKNGTFTWVSGESVLAKGKNDEVHILKVIQNIHQQKTAEISLQRLNEFNENILSSIEDAVIVLDEEMNILKGNHAFLHLFKPDKSGGKKLNFPDLVVGFSGSYELELLIEDAILHNKSFTNFPIELIAVDGEKKIFDVNGATMPHADGIKSVLLVVHDITVHKQIEKEREDVIGFVAHELRNPLANLSLCNELMSEYVNGNDELDVADLKDLLGRSKNNIKRLSKMIAELYDAARINSGNLKLDYSTFNLGGMAAEAIDTHRALQPAYNIIVEGDGDTEVSGDRYRLIQVVTNFLSNGIKYSDGKKDLLLTMTHDKDQFTISVKDEGMGISSRHLPFIFERFFRAEKTKKLEGIGLGLYLCRQIVVAHKGRIWAESEEGKGSVFYFSIPR